MKQSEFIKLINECVKEVKAESLTEGRKTKKSVAKEKAKKAIKEILTENELDESELEEIFGFGKKPATDEELNAYLSRNKALKDALDKMEPEKAKKWREFVKVKKASRIKDDEAILNVKWDNAKKEWTELSGPSTGGGFNK